MLKTFFQGGPKILLVTGLDLSKLCVAFKCYDAHGSQILALSPITSSTIQLKVLGLLHASEELAERALLLSFCDDSNLHVYQGRI